MFLVQDRIAEYRLDDAVQQLLHQATATAMRHDDLLVLQRQRTV
jgi:hypothetical protein